MRGKINQIHIKYTLRVPKLQANLLSVSKLVLNNLKVQFNLNKYFVKVCGGEAIAIVPHINNLYLMNFTKVHEADAVNLVQSPTEDGALKLWLCHLSHLNVKNIHMLKNMMSNMNI